MAKLLEILLLTHLKNHIAPIIRPHQFAFHQRHSTSNQLNKLIHELAISFNKKERTIAVFLNFEKAFDKIWHQGLISKFITLNIPCYNKIIVKSFLENRFFKVRFDNSFSDPHPISAGAPQDSWLSPIFFLLYINKFPSSLGTRKNFFC